MLCRVVKRLELVIIKFKGQKSLNIVSIFLKSKSQLEKIENWLFLLKVKGSNYVCG